MGKFYFVIVNSDDKLLFECDLRPTSMKIPLTDEMYLPQFVAHASLDVVDEIVWNINFNYLKIIDKFNDWLVSAFVTAGNTRFILLHEQKNDELIKSFMTETFEAYCKVLLNPLYTLNGKIESKQFNSKMLSLSAKYFP